MSRNKQRLLITVDVTLARTSLCVAGAVAAKGTAFARLTSTRFFVAILQILRDRSWTARWDLTWRKDVSEAGETVAPRTVAEPATVGPITTGRSAR